MSLDWNLYPNFSRPEMACRETGECGMHPDFMRRLQHLRDAFGKPMPVASGYRSPRHSIEAAKTSPGEHAFGRAVDIRISGPEALRLITLSVEVGFHRIGVQQKGPHDKRFIHLGDSPNFPPGIWSY